MNHSNVNPYPSKENKALYEQFTAAKSAYRNAHADYFPYDEAHAALDVAFRLASTHQNAIHDFALKIQCDARAIRLEEESISEEPVREVKDLRIVRTRALALADATEAHSKDENPDLVWGTEKYIELGFIRRAMEAEDPKEVCALTKKFFDKKEIREDPELVDACLELIDWVAQYDIIAALQICNMTRADPFKKYDIAYIEQCLWKELDLVKTLETDHAAQYLDCLKSNKIFSAIPLSERMFGQFNTEVKLRHAGAQPEDGSEEAAFKKKAGLKTAKNIMNAIGNMRAQTQFFTVETIERKEAKEADIDIDLHTLYTKIFNLTKNGKAIEVDNALESIKAKRDNDPYMAYHLLKTISTRTKYPAMKEKTKKQIRIMRGKYALTVSDFLLWVKEEHIKASKPLYAHAQNGSDHGEPASAASKTPPHPLPLTVRPPQEPS